LAVLDRTKGWKQLDPTIGLPINSYDYVPLRVRRRRRSTRRPLYAALTLLAIVAALVLFDRACIHGAPAPSPAAAKRAQAADPVVPGLSSGACASFAPTGGNRGRTVLIDAGHGGPDPGVVGRSSVREAAVSLAVSQEVARRLRADGYGVVLSRTSDGSVTRFGPDEITGGSMTSDQVRRDLQARIRCANASGAVALLSIHFNGYPDSTVSGSQTIYDAARPFAPDSKRLAESLQAALLKGLQLADRGIRTDDQLDAPTLSERAGSYGHLVLLGPADPGWVDKGTAMPGALVEPLFLTAPGEAWMASSPSGQRRIASALVSGLESYLAP
jgi:N-acetylmuramoyl-L-alanine amidase